MAEPNLPEHFTPPMALRVLRLIWAATLAGPIVMGGVLVVLAKDIQADIDPSLRPTLFLIAVGLLCVLAPLGLFIRNQTYKAYWRGPIVTPNGYVKGNIILFAMLDGVATVSLVMLFVTGFHPGLVGVAIAAGLLHLVNFPTGKPMQPRRPELPEPERL